MAKPIQLGFSARFQLYYCLIMIVVTAGASGLFYLLMNKSLSGGYVESLRILYFFDQNLPFYLSIMALLQAFFVLLLTLIIVLLVSHQIAGPVFRYEYVLGQICTGEIPEQVVTRSNDQLKTTVDSLNILTGGLRQIYESAKELQEKVGSEIAVIGPAEQAELQQKITAVRKAMGGVCAGDRSR